MSSQANADIVMLTAVDDSHCNEVMVAMDTSPVAAREMPIKYLSFEEQKLATDKLFSTGKEILEGTKALMDNKQLPMNLIGQKNPTAWDDSLRLHGSSLAAGSCVNAYPVNVAAIGKDFKESHVRTAQPYGISVGNTRYDANVHMMCAKYILISFKVRGEVFQVPLFSLEYFELMSAEHEMSGGTVEFEPLKSTDRDYVRYKEEFYNDLINSHNHVWKHTNAREWAIAHARWQLTGETMIPVYFRYYVASDNDSIAVMTRSIGHQLARKVSTSAGLSSLSYHNTCYTNNIDVVRNCIGVWNKNKNQGLEMCGIELKTSTTNVDKAGVASMIIAPVVEENDSSKCIDSMPVSDDTATKLPDANWGLLPFVGNTTHGTTFLSILNTPIRKIQRVVTKSATRSVGTTRGGGGTRSAQPVEPEVVSLIPTGAVAANSNMTFAKMGVGTPMYDVQGSGHFDAKTHRFDVPTFTIATFLVMKNVATDHFSSMSPEVYNAHAVQLVEAIAQQVRDTDYITTQCGNAVISGIQDSATAIKEEQMTAQQLSAFESTAAVNANADYFGL
jgi:hypothetical protein